MARLKTFRGFSVKSQFKLDNGMIRVKLYDVDVSPEDWEQLSGDKYFDGEQRRDVAKTTSYAGTQNDESHKAPVRPDQKLRPGQPSGRRTGGGKLAAR